MTSQQYVCGLGDINAELKVYIANRPPLDEYLHLRSIKALQPGDIETIVSQTGNHWRKIFNVYAKLAFDLDTQGCESWQKYRDDFLLSKESKQALLFSPPDFSEPGIHIITGRTYAQALPLDAELVAVDVDFQIDTNKHLLVVPYFDYRQLSNEKLARLLTLIRNLGH